MKNCKLNYVLVTVLSLISGNVIADSGLYIGAGAGYGGMNTTTTNGFSYLDGANSKSSSNMVGSVFVGYDFSKYVGVQADYVYLANMEYTTGSNAQTGVLGSFSANQQIVDLGITGHFPFEIFANALSGLSLFGKLAIGFSTVDFNGGAVGAGSDLSYVQELPSFSQSVIPVVGLGVEYGIGSVGARVEYDYFGSTSVSSSNQNLLNASTNLGMVSVFYHF